MKQSPSACRTDAGFRPRCARPRGDRRRARRSCRFSMNASTSDHSCVACSRHCSLRLWRSSFRRPSTRSPAGASARPAGDLHRTQRRGGRGRPHLGRRPRGPAGRRPAVGRRERPSVLSHRSGPALPPPTRRPRPGPVVPVDARPSRIPGGHARSRRRPGRHRCRPPAGTRHGAPHPRGKEALSRHGARTRRSSTRHPG